jgi:hypothetical protein
MDPLLFVVAAVGEARRYRDEGADHHTGQHHDNCGRGE